MDAMQAQAMARASAERRAAALQRVKAALKRIEAGDYGFCTACEEPIDPRRLEFDPAAAVCIDCASRLEQG
jgi:DnaK suppressor protein